MREQRVFKQTQNAYASNTADMSRRPGEVLVPDDKPRKFLRRVPTACYRYQWLLLKFACLAPAWELTTLTPEEAETWSQSAFRILIPDHLKKCLGIHKMPSILPYYYGTFKANVCLHGRSWAMFVPSLCTLVCVRLPAVVSGPFVVVGVGSSVRGKL